jgi:UDP-N-acetylglucosamine pyrophosphorylase
MTSDDTHAKTDELLKMNNYFGMNPEQVDAAVLVGSNQHSANLELVPLVSHSML